MQPIRHPVGRALVFLALVVFALYSVVPFIWTVLQSLKTDAQATALTPLIWFTPTLANYSRLWLNAVTPQTAPVLYGLLAVSAGLVLLGVFAGRLPLPVPVTGWGIVGVIAALLVAVPRLLAMAEFYDYFINSIIVSVAAVAVSLTLASLSGYALARYAGRASVVILLAALAFRALPRMGFLLPYYWMGQRSGLYDTHFLTIMALVAVNQPFSIWLLRGFFREVPRDLEEAAMIDGASRLTAFVRVIIPIMWPGIIAAGLFTLLLAYHEFLLVRILTQSNWTLSVAMAQFVGGFSVAGSISLQSAAAVSATLPIVIVVLIFQKHLVRGLAAGAVKG
ncbi:MAG: carbohydrate ABC transporter permease [Anaerolineales bacterium]|nr:carbohydrate ABC transporter permease [Anaerolineales bacterium]